MARVVGGERIALPNLKFLFCPRPSSLTGLIIFLKKNIHERIFLPVVLIVAFSLVL